MGIAATETLLTCRITGWLVQPIEIVEDITVMGRRWIQWRCPVCDWNENKRGDFGYNPNRPGPHASEIAPLTRVQNETAAAANCDGI